MSFAAVAAGRDRAWDSVHRLAMTAYWQRAMRLELRLRSGPTAHRAADTGFASKQHHLTFGSFCLRPAPQQQFEFFFPPNKFCQSCSVHRLETAFRRTRPQHRPGPRGSGDAVSLPSRPAQRREQIKLQVALANALMHTKGYAAAETRAALDQVRSLIEQAEALGEPPDDPSLLFSILYGFWAANLIAFDGSALQVPKPYLRLWACLYRRFSIRLSRAAADADGQATQRRSFRGLDRSDQAR